MLRAVAVPLAREAQWGVGPLVLVACVVEQALPVLAVALVAALVWDIPVPTVPGADLDRAADTVVAATAAEVDKASADATRKSVPVASSPRCLYHSGCRPAPAPRSTLHNKGNAYLDLPFCYCYDDTFTLLYVAIFLALHAPPAVLKAV